ncbi:T-cell differentiation antigen CD6, partial [Erinaceus europaeus]|uniref:T-cell differentiation antigen CD6 n=1 Tax=Erinaceus europaeus TaxID=9365 RepID=A0ABM3W567_ERIEU
GCLSWGPGFAGQQLGVRLVAGSSRCSGTVEVWRHLSWEPVCGDFWNFSAAEAVCRALGCGGVGAIPSLTPEVPSLPAADNASRAANTTRTLAPVVLCSGDTTEWSHCQVEDFVCSGHAGLARITCAENRALRLVGGGPCAGRVDLLERGQWGSLCDDTWDLADAHVVCRQLGCGWAIQALPGLHYPSGQGPIHRDQVNCSGAEAYLWDCPGLLGGGYCGHKEDAGVVCSEHQSWRLTGGVDACEGQAEVHFRGVWNTVCDSEWYSPEAGVLCRALGCGSAVLVPKGLPHSLPGRMYYSCRGEEPTLSNCSWRYNNSNLCSQSQAARVVCSESRRLLNLSTSDVPATLSAVTVEPSVTENLEEGLDSQELRLLILCIVLGTLLLASLTAIAVILWKIRGKYALPVTVNHQHLPAPPPAGINSYQDAPTIIPKEVPKLSFQAQAPPPEDPASSSDSDYEHYDFSAQPPMALSTFYNSQRHRPTEEEVQQNRFQMPPLEEEPPANLPPTQLCIADFPSLGPQHHRGSFSGSSTSSGEDYCNSPRSQESPWPPLGFPMERCPFLEQPPNLELAGSQATFSGPSADNSSSTSSGEWYQNVQPPPLPLTPPEEQFRCPGSPSPQPASTDNDDYDDIGAT